MLHKMLAGDPLGFEFKSTPVPRLVSIQFALWPDIQLEGLIWNPLAGFSLIRKNFLSGSLAWIRRAGHLRINWSF
jgi:hypothetical protein